MDERTVFVYKMTGDKTYGGLAMHVSVRDGELRFFDTIRGHQQPGRVTGDTPEGFTFRCEGFEPGAWQFKKLTLPEFRRKYAGLVIGGEDIAAAMHTTEDLQEWFRKQFGFRT